MCFLPNLGDFETEGLPNAYPKDPHKLTGVSTRTHFAQIALTPKQAGLVWTFFNTMIV